MNIEIELNMWDGRKSKPRTNFITA